MGRENLPGIAVIALLTLALSACSEMSNGSAESAAEVTVVAAKKTVQDANLAVEIQLTDKLPYALSKNYATGLQFTGMELQSGHKSMLNPPPRPAKNVRVDVVATPSHQKTIRMKMTHAKLTDVFGETEASSSKKKLIWLSDKAGMNWFPIGYIIRKPDSALVVNIDRFGIKQGKDLPINELGRDDEFYLFFTVSRDSQINQLNVGDARLRHTKTLNLPSLP
jgi:hypothetical protein